MAFGIDVDAALGNIGLPSLPSLSDLPSPAVPVPSSGVEKATLRALTGGKPLKFQFNPSTLAFQKSVVYQPRDQQASPVAAPLVYRGQGVARIELQLFLDSGDEAANGVMDDVTLLFSWTCKPEDNQNQTSSPPLVRFQWGRLKLDGKSGTFDGVIEQVSVTYQLFRRDGIPIRAEANVKLTQQPEQPKGTNPTSGGLRPQRSHRMQRGDTLHALAYEHYGDVNHWKALARANGVDNPFALAPGTEILIPEFEETRADVAAGAGSRPEVRIAGTSLAAPLEVKLVACEVESDPGAPDACRLRFSYLTDSEVRQAGIDFLAPLEIRGIRRNDASPAKVFAGRIYRIGYEYEDSTPQLSIVAYDASYALFNGPKTRTFVNVKDSDVARQIARDAGLELGTIEETATVHPHVSQFDQTDWDFLLGRARENGYELETTGGTLSFRLPVAATNAPRPGDYSASERTQLNPGKELDYLAVHLTAAQQVSEVRVNGWDPQTKKPVEAKARPQTSAADVDTTPEDLGGRTNGTHVTTDVPLASQAVCEDFVKAEAERIASTFAFAEGVAQGDPTLLAGTAVSFGETGAVLKGKYTLTSVRHEWTDGDYRLHFRVSGNHDRSLLGLTRGASARPGAATGVVIGKVEQVDKENPTRVKLSFPWLAPDYVSDWARVLQVGAGKERGFFVMPEPKDEVLVAFDHGDVRRPYVLGGLYNGVDVPPDPAIVADDGAVNRRIWKSRTGHVVTLDDTNGEEKITIATGDEKIKVVLDQAAGGSLQITVAGDVTVNSDGAATVKARGDVKVEAGQRVSIKATNGITLDGGGGRVEIKGSQIALN